MSDLIEHNRRATETLLRLHAASAWTEESLPPEASNGPLLQPRVRFSSLPKIALPTNIVDAPVPTLSLLSELTDAVPESMRDLPQDLWTLATWLYLSAGVTFPKKDDGVEVRAWPSAGWTYPCELYVAAFAIGDLDPGLYHFSPHEFALRRLRGPAETLELLRRGRPEFDLLADVPAAMLVTANLAAATHRFASRGFRLAMLEAGQLLEQCTKVGNGLGLHTITRLQLPDDDARALLGLSPDTPFAADEVPAGFIAWTDAITSRREFSASDGAMLPLSRDAVDVVANDSVAEARRMSVTSDDSLAELLPPLTNLSPLPRSAETINPQSADHSGGLLLSQVIRRNTFTQKFVRQGLRRDTLVRLNRLVFRGGTYQPFAPDDAHIATTRPFWIVHDVAGFEPGIWYFDPMNDEWAELGRGDMRFDAKFACLGDEAAADASAVCVMTANLSVLMNHSGPDLYRLAHLEAGVCTERMFLAAAGQGLSVRSMPAFDDAAIKQLLGLSKTTWEPLQVVALGAAPGASVLAADAADEMGFRE